MTRYDAEKVRWTPMEIRGVHGYFSDVRIERDTVPAQFQMWELVDADSDGVPCRYRRGILVNFYGTFLTIRELPIDNARLESGYIETEEEWGFSDEWSMTLEALMEKETEQGGS